MKYLTKKRFSMKQVVLLLSLVIVGIAVLAYASTVAPLNTFTSGTTISSSEMNANFTAVKTAVDDNDARITVLEQNKSIVAYDQEDTCCTAITTPVAHQSVTINAPSSGNVLVSFNGMCGLDHINGQYTRIALAISTVSGSLVTASRGDIQVPSAAPSDFYTFRCSAQQVYPVSAGSTTFYLNVDNTSTGAGIVNIGWGNLQAIFIPN